MERANRADEWDRRARQEGLYAVMSRRWTPEQCQEVHQQHIQLLLNWLSPLRGKWVLDLGCGIGRLSSVLLKHGAVVVGVDTNETMLQKAKTNLEGTQAFFLHGTADHLPLASTSVDGALAVMVLQHILDDLQFEAALHEMGRVVRPRGRILIVDGTAEARFQPINSPITIVRMPSDYDALKDSCQLLSFSQLKSATDDYSVMVWERKQL